MAFDELNNLISEAERILISGPAHPNADVISTAAAWALYFNKENKKVDLVFDGQISHYSYLPKNLEYKSSLESLNRFKIILDTTDTKVKQLSYDVLDKTLEINIVSDGGTFNSQDVSTEQGEYKYDLILVLGASSLDLLGKVFSEHRSFFNEVPIINLDRSVANENYGQLNIVDTKSTALAEVSYEYLLDKMDETIATQLLAGMIAATNSFQSPQVTPHTLELASDLIVRGANRGEVVEALYRTKDIATLKNWGRVLSRLNKQDYLLSSYLKHDELDDLPQDFQELIKELVLTTPQAQAAIIFYELELEKTEAWLYTMDNIDALELVKEFNPHGHRRFVKVTIDHSLAIAQETLLQKIGQKLAIINRA